MFNGLAGCTGNAATVVKSQHGNAKRIRQLKWNNSLYQLLEKSRSTTSCISEGLTCAHFANKRLYRCSSNGL